MTQMEIAFACMVVGLIIICVLLVFQVDDLKKDAVQLTVENMRLRAANKTGGDQFRILAEENKKLLATIETFKRVNDANYTKLPRDASESSESVW